MVFLVHIFIYITLFRFGNKIFYDTIESVVKLDNGAPKFYFLVFQNRNYRVFRLVYLKQGFLLWLVCKQITVSHMIALERSDSFNVMISILSLMLFREAVVAALLIFFFLLPSSVIHALASNVFREAVFFIPGNAIFIDVPVNMQL